MSDIDLIGKLGEKSRLLGYDGTISQYIPVSAAEQAALNLPAHKSGQKFFNYETGQILTWSNAALTITGYLGVPSTVIQSADGYTAAIDHLTNGLVAIDSTHNRIHRGLMFSLSGQIAGVAAAGTAYIMGLTDSKKVHFSSGLVMSSKTPVTITLYEGATTSASGTQVFAKNRRRSSANVPTMLTYIGPTVTTPGTVLESGLIPDAQGNTGGESILFGAEWMLDLSNTKYLIAITNNSGQTATINYNFLWYESE